MQAPDHIKIVDIHVFAVAAPVLDLLRILRENGLFRNDRRTRLPPGLLRLYLNNQLAKTSSFHNRLAKTSSFHNRLAKTGPNPKKNIPIICYGVIFLLVEGSTGFGPKACGAATSFLSLQYNTAMHAAVMSTMEK